jgi:hypothetical protein
MFERRSLGGEVVAPRSFLAETQRFLRRRCGATVIRRVDVCAREVLLADAANL